MQQVITRFYFFLILIGFVFVLGANDHALKSVNSNDLANGRLVVIGQSELPIGTCLDLECERVANVTKDVILKSVDVRVRILKINGAECKSHIEYSADLVSMPIPGDRAIFDTSTRFRCRGYQGLRTIGVPDNLFPDGRNPIQSSRSFGLFETVDIVGVTKID